MSTTLLQPGALPIELRTHGTRTRDPTSISRSGILRTLHCAIRALVRLSGIAPEFPP